MTKFEFLWATFGMHVHVYEGLNMGTVKCLKGSFDYWLSDSGEWVYHAAA
jgi:hypothetical protein